MLNDNTRFAPVGHGLCRGLAGCTRAPSSQKCRLDLVPPWADRFILGFPIDYGPVLLLRPFGFHLTLQNLCA